MASSGSTKPPPKPTFPSSASSPISSATTSPCTAISTSRPSSSSSSPTPSSRPTSPATSSARSSPPARTKPTSSPSANPTTPSSPASGKNIFTDALDDFEALDRDIIKGFRHFNDAGLIEIITCCATHGYMPLLGTDESVRAQIRTAVTAHQRHIGKHPRGIWAPECGYRPAGLWNYPRHPDRRLLLRPSLPPHRRRAGPQRVRHRLLLRRHPPHRRVRPRPLPLRAPQRRRRRPQRRAHDPQRLSPPLPALLRRRLLRSRSPAVPHHRLPPRPRHRHPGLVRQLRLPRRRQLPRLPQEALARRSSLLVRHRLQHRHGRQAALRPPPRRRAHPGPRLPLRPSRLGSHPRRHERHHPAHPLLPVRRRALRPLVVRRSALARSRRPHPP